jgi:hypothetical protein
MAFGDLMLPYSHYSRDQYKKLIKDAGFEILSFEDIPLGGYLFTWVKARKL